jgi:hypothetical protein
MRILSSIFTMGILALTPLASQAATLEYNFPVPTTIGGTGNNEIRATFLEVLKPIFLDRLTASLALDSTADIKANWTVYNSNAADDVLGAVKTVDASFSFTGSRLEEQLVTTAIDVALNPGFYLFALQTDAQLFYTNYPEPDLPVGTLPFVTSDGAFSVIDGGVIDFNASDPSIISGNVRLPAISAEYTISTVPAVPLPAGGLLLLTALGAVVGAKRRFSTKT